MDRRAMVLVQLADDLLHVGDDVAVFELSLGERLHEWEDVEADELLVDGVVFEADEVY